MKAKLSPNQKRLRRRVFRSLRSQGFVVQNNRVSIPNKASKDDIRQLHSHAIAHRLDASKNTTQREPQLIKHIANGNEIQPELFDPRLVRVQPGSEEELLFRYVSLHWSIPVSSGYGRRLRFLIIDEFNQKLVGILGLGDPVYSLRARDSWIGWGQIEKSQRLRHVMEAFVLGAVPPYSFLLCGKLIAMLASSDEVRKAVSEKYAGHTSLIGAQKFDGQLALVTTTSALGRSSIYRRLRYNDRYLFQSVGFSSGSGEFHFSNGLYEDITRYTLRYCTPTAKHSKWGTGFRNRREAVRKFLAKIGLPSKMLYHGVKREVFVVPLAENTREFLSGKDSKLVYFSQSADDLIQWFKERWFYQRARSDRRFENYHRSQYLLLNDK